MAEYLIYNPGLPIEESLKFSLSSDRTDHAVGNWQFRLESKSFTPVPTELPIGDGETTLRVEFPFDIVRKFGERGVTLLITEKEKIRRFGTGAIPDNQAFATSEEAAQVKGDQLWNDYTLHKAEEHVNAALEARAAGGTLRKAQGFTAFCLKMHNIVDPADEMYLRMTKGSNDQLQSQVNQLTTAFNALISIPGVKEALAAAGVSSPTVAPTTGAEPSPAPVKPAQQGNRPGNRKPQRGGEMPSPTRTAPPNAGA